jgi:squalene-hopene/tetraprenyl-beta-curcumene cyclase
LPFDRSSADITAHALRAWVIWQGVLPAELGARVQAGIRRAVAFLLGVQESDGAWCPLWFGNEDEVDNSNRVYGTSRVLLALADTNLGHDGAVKAVRWLVQSQKPDGVWSGGLAASSSSVEETALALEALSAAFELNPRLWVDLKPVILRGVSWLLIEVGGEAWPAPKPIGFYFANLWYYEELYPLVFTAAALGRAGRVANR